MTMRLMTNPQAAQQISSSMANTDSAVGSSCA